MLFSHRRILALLLSLSFGALGFGAQGAWFHHRCALRLAGSVLPDALIDPAAWSVKGGAFRYRILARWSFFAQFPQFYAPIPPAINSTEILIDRHGENVSWTSVWRYPKLMAFVQLGEPREKEVCDDRLFPLHRVRLIELEPNSGSLEGLDRELWTLARAAGITSPEAYAHRVETVQADGRQMFTIGATVLTPHRFLEFAAQVLDYLDRKHGPRRRR